MNQQITESKSVALPLGYTLIYRSPAPEYAETSTKKQNSSLQIITEFCRLLFYVQQQHDCIISNFSWIVKLKFDFRLIIQKQEGAFMYDSQKVASLIKETAEKRNVTVTKLLNDCGLNKNAISELSKGKQISSFSLAKIADYLDVSVDYLLDRDNYQKMDLSDDQKRLLQMYKKLSDMEKGEILGELKAMTTNRRPVQTVLAVARSVDNRPPRLITSDFSDILNAPDISDKY